MDIDIQLRSDQITGLLLERVAQRAQRLLAHVRDHVRKVTVRLFDVNRPNGGQDKRCVVQVKLNRLPEVTTEETHENFRLAIDRALIRAGRAAKRRLERPRERRCGAPRNLAQLQRPRNCSSPDYA